nr:hypothetical protein SHINE37_44246 [Rhizobiaceae bacterium]
MFVARLDGSERRITGSVRRHVLVRRWYRDSDTSNHTSKFCGCQKTLANVLGRMLPKSLENFGVSQTSLDVEKLGNGAQKRTRTSTPRGTGT